MLVGQALKLCPEMMVISPDFHLYRQFSRRFMEIAGSYTPLLEAVSIDECFLDITGSKQFGTPLEIAEAIQARIREELKLPCSVGLAPNKLLAKIASDMKKPNGLTVLRLRDVPGVLWNKPCDTIYGIGKRTAEKLERLNIRTVGQLAASDETMLTKEFGIMGAWLKRAAHGKDDSPVNPIMEASKSVGHTTTLPSNFTEKADINRVFLNLADQVSRRMRRQGLIASTISITIRDPDMKTITRAITLDAPTESFDEIYKEACRLFARHWPEGKPVRLLGITLQSLQPRSEAAIQMDLFDYERQPKKENLNKTMDQIRDKFGESAILTAGMLSEDPSALIRNHKTRGTSLQMDHLRPKAGKKQQEEEE